jgi:type IV secretory pathway TraG/TraD family ATPase VirD4
MNDVASLLERIAVGPEIDLADEPVLDLGGGHLLTRRDLTEALVEITATGKGKSTHIRTIGRALVRNCYGGLVLTVKASQIGDFQSLCRMEGREADCLVLAPGGPHAYNPLHGETNASEAAALVSELAEVLASRVGEGGENDAFWRAQLAIILRNLFTLSLIAHGRCDVVQAAELFDSRANSTAEIADPNWQQNSPLAAAIAAARGHSQNDEARLAADYFAKVFPSHGDRLQGSLAATVSSVFDHLRRSPLRELFTGESTFDMDDLLDNAKICVVGLPALDSADGRIANALMQYCFCRAATRRPRKHYSFLLCDECQETVSRALMQKLAVMREFKVATVLLTQNLAVLDDKIGETAREGLLGLMGAKLFGPQGHAGTRQWAAEQIGKRKVEVETTTKGRTSGGSSNSSSSTSVHQQWDYRVPPSRFAELNVGETICLRDGKVWRARWHKDLPGKRGTVRIV